MRDEIWSHVIDVVILGKNRWGARVYECEWGGPERHYGEGKGCQMFRCARCIPLGIQRVDEEGVALWPRVVVILDEGKLGTSETAKVVNSSERTLLNHLLEEDSACERVRYSKALTPITTPVRQLTK